MDNLKVKVTSYKDYVIIEPLQFEEEKDVLYPVGNGRVGTVLIDTKKYLGMSKEAVENLKRVKKSHDAIGDLQAWKSDKGDCFGWLGGMKAFYDVTKADSDRNGIIDIAHVTIPNDVPQEAMAIINKSIAGR
jgi:hypothetical protein